MSAIVVLPTVMIAPHLKDVPLALAHLLLMEHHAHAQLDIFLLESLNVKHALIIA